MVWFNFLGMCMCLLLVIIFVMCFNLLMFIVFFFLLLFLLVLMIFKLFFFGSTTMVIGFVICLVKCVVLGVSVVDNSVVYRFVFLVCWLILLRIVFKFFLNFKFNSRSVSSRTSYRKLSTLNDFVMCKWFKSWFGVVINSEMFLCNCVFFFVWFLFFMIEFVII